MSKSESDVVLKKLPFEETPDLDSLMKKLSECAAEFDQELYKFKNKEDLNSDEFKKLLKGTSETMTLIARKIVHVFDQLSEKKGREKQEIVKDEVCSTSDSE